MVLRHARLQPDTRHHGRHEPLHAGNGRSQSPFPAASEHYEGDGRLARASGSALSPQSGGCTDRISAGSLRSMIFQVIAKRITTRYSL